MDLRNRQTVSKRLPEIDSLYVYQTGHEIKDLKKRQQPGSNYRYKNHKAIELAGEGEIYTYHQTLEIDSSVVGVTIVTKEHRITKIRSFIKEAAKQIKENDKKLTIFKSARTTPKEIGIYYLAS